MSRMVRSLLSANERWRPPMWKLTRSPVRRVLEPPSRQSLAVRHAAVDWAPTTSMVAGPLAMAGAATRVVSAVTRTTETPARPRTQPMPRRDMPHRLRCPTSARKHHGFRDTPCASRRQPLELARPSASHHARRAPADARVSHQTRPPQAATPAKRLAPSRPASHPLISRPGTDTPVGPLTTVPSTVGDAAHDRDRAGIDRAATPRLRRENRAGGRRVPRTTSPFCVGCGYAWQRPARSQSLCAEPGSVLVPASRRRLGFDSYKSLLGPEGTLWGGS